MRNLILLLLIVFLPAFAADETTLRIVVTNQNGNPVDNANVRVKFVAGRSKTKFGAKINTSWEMKTNQEGVAKPPSMPQGKILIQVTAKNYQTFGKNFDIDQEQQTIEIKLNPPQPQYTSHPQ